MLFPYRVKFGFVVRSYHIDALRKENLLKANPFIIYCNQRKCPKILDIIVLDLVQA